MADFDAALKIMAEAHRGQIDKSGAPYGLHPIRVMLRHSNEQERIVALLHDVVEDSVITLDDLSAAGFCEEIVIAVGCLTKKNEEAYEDFIGKISNNKLATAVKISDLIDNLDLKRLKCVSNADLERAKKYHKALIFLSNKL